MATFVRISRQDMHDFLTAQGFAIIPHIPGTQELVYGKIVGKDLCLRVYTSIAGNASRDNGADAIRTVLVTRIDGNVKIVGVDKRVHRVEGWRNNLQERLDTWGEQLGPDCPCCGSLTAQRRSKHGPFWGCVNYPSCKGIVSCSEPVRRAPVTHLGPDNVPAFQPSAGSVADDEFAPPAEWELVGMDLDD